MTQAKKAGRAMVPILRDATVLLAGCGAVVLLAGCGGAGVDGGAGASWTAVRDTVGDTVVVRTVSGSVWGGEAHLEEDLRIGALEGPEETTFGHIAGIAVGPDRSIYVLDRQVPALRKYAPDGSYVATFGREGGGPGEYKHPDGGLAVLPDGRVLLRDPGNARISVYSSDGEYLESWPTAGGLNTSNPLYVDTAGRALTYMFSFGDEPGDFRTFLVRLGPEGQTRDTLFPPRWKEPPQLTATFKSKDGSSSSMSMRNVPFMPRGVWTFSPLGYLVGGYNDRYALKLYRPDAPVLRIERELDPLQVTAAERNQERAITTYDMRRTDPNWRWKGPDIPDVKPAYKGVFVDLDDRIWVSRSTAAERMEVEEESPSPAEAGRPRRPLRHWQEPLLFDVFEPDGRYLGPVRPPPAFQSPWPQPVARGDRVWAMEKDELEVEYVVRYRMVH